MADLNALDKIKHQLEEQFPGWHIWYVPHHGGATAWCAQPWPLINSYSPEHLAEEIRQAHAEAAENWPALARENERTA